MSAVKPEDTVILYDPEKDKKYIVNLAVTSGKFNTEKGEIELESLVGLPYGSEVKTHLGHVYYLLPCTLYEFIMYKLRRLTQIIYPKDAAYIVLRLDVKPGDLVVESGIGSGALTAVFAQLVGPEGKVVSYERREEFVKNALSNLRRFGLADRVEVKLRDIEEGFDEREEADALFLDVREPWLYLDRAYAALKPGRMLGVLLPTANQVIETLKGLKELPFIDVEVCEILLRRYKTVPERFRPEDRMPAHTAYLLFARKLKGEKSGSV
ncbi:protein-L-isoaspartate(D-aspartate) O-methyltransferase [Thermovibrio ammonificans HB-1]|uniref:tRNA (adenine(58)-N(1))-methyltransferase TrmI n=1 Tax=Thermovibrio ammonificans (strain DSM 15698 / JCM 12110 / HB-1) TaxID=648996 RepID=E8T2I0_THEA1|nr:tRNA (adenine-N1)-methyltransferase [Thermovibrio ammonificans]ADU97075.1 protein-L-isoaspartate(D-aspartate) O-methyltransferase [Thermovibrio ammonificans HB-1]